MKIKSLEIIGLNGSEQPINLTFNDDLNIITGRNGAGKTTILKIIWFIISGHIQSVFDEISFKKITLESEFYSLTLLKDKEKILINNINQVFSLFEELTDFNFPRKPPKNFISHELPSYSSSLFFTTFRRMEGGFFSNSKEYIDLHEDIDIALNNITTNFSNFNHHFITAVGTHDIEYSLMSKFYIAFEEINEQQENLNRKIVEKITNSKDELKVLAEIKEEIETLNLEKAKVLQPLTSFKLLLQKFFKNKDINISDEINLIIGNPQKAINSDLLSAGEKQMLSFLAYNAVYNDTIFIIDEPELSLHGDWQRLLIPTLLKQNPSNQFIMATHSPFIYSKYPDKELRLVSDRGNTDNKQDVITRGKHG